MNESSWLVCSVGWFFLYDASLTLDGWLCVNTVRGYIAGVYVYSQGREYIAKLTPLLDS